MCQNQLFVFGVVSESYTGVLPKSKTRLVCYRKARRVVLPKVAARRLPKSEVWRVTEKQGLACYRNK
jgi:hypothetical protein